MNPLLRKEERVAQEQMRTMQKKLHLVDEATFSSVGTETLHSDFLLFYRMKSEWYRCETRLLQLSLHEHQ
jgi:hypothetical protein